MPFHCCCCCFASLQKSIALKLFPRLPAAVQNNHLLLQVDQILFSSKAAALSGLLTDHFSLRGPLWNGTLSNIEVLYTEFYLCVIWECGADNVGPKMTMNCLEEERGLWYNFKSIYWWLRKKAKTVLFFFEY